jgi:hypothetical protein
MNPAPVKFDIDAISNMHDRNSPEYLWFEVFDSKITVNNEA